MTIALFLAALAVLLFNLGVLAFGLTWLRDVRNMKQAVRLHLAHCVQVDTELCMVFAQVRLLAERLEHAESCLDDDGRGLDTHVDHKKAS